jgi:methylated-DNA-[protein]-cysteine S-methyltransferase
MPELHATACGFAVFDTAMGTCGIAWSERGIVGVHLPERSAGEVRARLGRRWPAAREEAPPTHVRQVMDGIVSLLAGERTDLTAARLDMEAVEPFERRVYEAARAIPPGETLTYGALAARIGKPGAAREVGRALGRNPFGIVVPCHRIVAADGLGGFSARGGTSTKMRLLAAEGAPVAGALDLFGDGGV